MRSLLDFDWKWFVVRLYKRSFEADLLDRAASVAFYFAFSLFPLLLFLLSLFGLILGSTEALQEELLSYFARILPPPAFELVKLAMTELALESSTSKLTFGLVFGLWAASAGVDSIRNALNAVYQIKETRFWGLIKLQSLVLTFLVVILVVFVLAAFFYGWQLAQIGLGYIGLNITSPLILVTIQWAAIILVLLLACEVIYNLLPNFKVRKWIWITPGSLVAILLFIALTSGFRIYLEFSSWYSRVYGSLGAATILLLWLYLTSFALMVGGLINAVLLEKRELKVDSSDGRDT